MDLVTISGSTGAVIFWFVERWSRILGISFQPLLQSSNSVIKNRNLLIKLAPRRAHPISTALLEDDIKFQGTSFPFLLGASPAPGSRKRRPREPSAVILAPLSGPPRDRSFNFDPTILSLESFDRRSDAVAREKMIRKERRRYLEGDQNGPHFRGDKPIGCLGQSGRSVCLIDSQIQDGPYLSDLNGFRIPRAQKHR